MNSSRQEGERSAAPFGELLRRHRVAAGISQEHLAELARISVSAVSALERGVRRAPYRETVALLATALGLAELERARFETAAERARGRPAKGADGSASAHNLPARLTSFVGRENEMAQIDSLLQTNRLVTLTGSGGVGKTRTAIEVARSLLGERFEEARFVDLAPVTDGAFVAGAVASALDVPLARAGDPLASLAAGLSSRACLLVLDNCEHVIKEAAATASAILHGCPDVVILATSRERLAIQGESLYRMPSLFVPEKAPETIEDARAYPALRLFIERASAADSRLVMTAERAGIVAQICTQLEGIPLAIELAATRLPTLGFNALNERLKARFGITGAARDLPKRHQTMLATIAWSYDLLSGDERVLLRRLAIFRGGLTLEAAESVCADELLASRDVADLLSVLVDKSLLTVTSIDERSRYAMLESVRAFATEQLEEAGEFSRVARAHALWLAAVGDRGEDKYAKVPRAEWLAEFGPEIDNARGALEWTLCEAQEEDAALAARILGGLRGLWMSAERRMECRRWAEAALQQLDAARYPQLAARLMRAHIQSIDGAAVFAAVDRAIPLFERLGDRHGLISLYAHVAWEYGLRGKFAEADDAIARAFMLAGEERLQFTRQYVHLLHARCLIRALAGRLAEARGDASEAARLRLAIGQEDPIVESYWDAFFRFADGDVRGAADTLETCVGAMRARAKNAAGPLSELAAARLVLGNVEAAETAACESLELARVEQLESAWRAIQHLAAVAALRGDPRTGARLLGFVDAWCDRNGGVRAYYERASHDILTSSLSAQLPAGDLPLLAAAGAALDFESAVNEALGN